MTHTSITDRDGDLERSAREALNGPDAFARFKQLSGIKAGIERLSPARGEEYRAIVRRQTPDLLKYLGRFKTSDAIGNPDTAPYPEGMMSPTTWRYIKVLSDLKLLFGSLDGWRIAEIGVGYGGQCKIIGDRYDVASYTMYDLQPVSQLAEAYLREAASGISAKLKLADFRELGRAEPDTYDLVISNWALSECTREVQDCYIQHVLRRSSHGYITYNQISHLRGIDSYRTDGFIDALGFQTELMSEGLGGIPDELANFILYWPALGATSHRSCS